MTDPAAIDTPGLRERKRLATRRAILLAAVQVVLDKGLDATTVDEIARVADVSPRTFFNYFSSKEDAIVGDGPELPDEEAQLAFIADRSPILPAIAKLFGDSMTPALHDQEIVLLRRGVMKANPDLGGKRWATVHRFELEVIALVERRLADEHPELTAFEVRKQARLTALIAIAAMRHAWMTWMDDNGEHGSLLERLAESFDELPGIAATSVRA
jgi:AcrR family transcriptional regulator